MKNRSVIVAAVLGAMFVGTLWAFPAAWYTKKGAEQFVWLTERTNLTGWTFEPTSLSKSEEAALTADVTATGTFTKGADAVQVFAAKRFSNDPNEIGLFVHTPDRCWAESGWKFRSSAPDVTEVEIHGVKATCERRVFQWRSGEEMLVYFFGLSSGQALPYRLDHNLSTGQKQQVNAGAVGVGARARAVDGKLWGRVWECFESQQQIVGPKQFFRVATLLRRGDEKAADARLREVLNEWLQPGDFLQEAAAFAAAASAEKAKKKE
jgi:hypothetical protein